MFKRPPLRTGVLIVILSTLALDLFYNIDGFGFRGKTVWDWLGLLIVPAILLIGSVWINSTIQRNDEARAEKRAEVDRQIADDRLKEQALQAYLDRMSELLLNGHFDNPDTRDKAKTVTRARTLTILRGLDGVRKGVLLRFLYESDLITGDRPNIDLSDADFSKADLAEASLSNANLVKVNLVKAHLEMAHLNNAHLQEALLIETDLEAAELKAANLEGAMLVGANLMNSDLREANLTGATLAGASLQLALLGQANLERTHLEGANLTDATVSLKQLEKTTRDENTILPDGSHYQEKSP